MLPTRTWDSITFGRNIYGSVWFPNEAQQHAVSYFYLSEIIGSRLGGCLWRNLGFFPAIIEQFLEYACVIHTVEKVIQDVSRKSQSGGVSRSTPTAPQWTAQSNLHQELVLYRPQLGNLIISIPKTYFLALDRCFRHAQYYKMLLVLRSLNERALGTRIKESQLF